jgi:hypothetical protein
MYICIAFLMENSNQSLKVFKLPNLKERTVVYVYHISHGEQQQEQTFF